MYNKPSVLFLTILFLCLLTGCSDTEKVLENEDVSTQIPIVKIDLIQSSITTINTLSFSSLYTNRTYDIEDEQTKNLDKRKTLGRDLVNSEISIDKELSDDVEEIKNVLIQEIGKQFTERLDKIDGKRTIRWENGISLGALGNSRRLYLSLSFDVSSKYLLFSPSINEKSSFDYVKRLLKKEIVGIETLEGGSYVDLFIKNGVNMNFQVNKNKKKYTNGDYVFKKEDLLLKYITIDLSKQSFWNPLPINDYC